MIPEQIKNELTPKYYGIYKKAKTGRSLKAAVHINCLLCTGCNRKAIKDCNDIVCPFHQYRPYQQKPYKCHKPTNVSNLSRCATGKILKTGQKTRTLVSKSLIIKNPPEGRIRLKIEITPEEQKC